MPTPTPAQNVPRKLEDIQVAYEALVSQLGERDYRILVLQSEKAAIHKLLNDLNSEADRARLFYRTEEHTNGRHAESGPHAEPAQS